MLEEISLWVLSKLPAEFAHNVAKRGMKRGLFAPGEYRTTESETELFGVKLPNPFGVAAGFDKYAELHGVVRNYGFAWIEEGSFTFGGGRGNKKPRLFRLENGGLLNRMGLNCISSERAAEIYESVEDQTTFAVNIAKTNDKNISGDKAIEDIVRSYVALRKFGIYTVINVSCPNTWDGRTFEDNPDNFKELVSELGIHKSLKTRPLVFKFSPSLSSERLEELVDISYELVDGYEALNTRPIEHSEYGKGGVSGQSLKLDALGTVRFLKEIVRDEKVILGVGGISTGKELYNMIEAGANACLAYTGFVYRNERNPYAGPRFAHFVLREYEKLKDGRKEKSGQRFEAVRYGN